MKILQKKLFFPQFLASSFKIIKTQNQSLTFKNFQVKQRKSFQTNEKTDYENKYNQKTIHEGNIVFISMPRLKIKLEL